MTQKIVFNFDESLEYQRNAINAVVDLFKGQDRELGDVIYRGATRHIKRLGEKDPVRNRLDIGPSIILNNMREVQNNNMLFPSNTFDTGYNFTVEMETGERVIIVTGCINILISRVSETFIENNSCIS